MNIAGTEYNLNHKALEIYLSGCKSPHCPNCHNEALWDFNVGKVLDDNETDKLLTKTMNPMVEKVWIMGGEPLDQDLDELEWLLIYIWRVTNCERWLWTRYTEIPELISKHLSYAKIGEYREDLPSYTNGEHGITLASSNQRIIKLDK